MKTKLGSNLLTPKLLQWANCTDSSIQCHSNGLMELLLQSSGISQCLYFDLQFLIATLVNYVVAATILNYVPRLFCVSCLINETDT